MSKEHLKEGLFKKARAMSSHEHMGDDPHEEPDYETAHRRIGAMLDKDWAARQFGNNRHMMKRLMAKANQRIELKKQAAKLKEEITQALGDGSAIAGCNRDDVPGPKKRRPIIRRR